jgi:hypothetical protein
MKEPGTLNDREVRRGGAIRHHRVQRGLSHLEALVDHRTWQAFEYSQDEITGKLSDFTRRPVPLAQEPGCGSRLHAAALRADREPLPGNQPAFFDMSVPGPELFFRASF